MGDPFESLLKSFMALSTLFRVRIGVVADDFKVSVVQMSAMTYAGAAPRVSLATLAEKLAVRPETAHATAREMVANKLATMTVDPVDASQVWIALTPKGRLWRRDSLKSLYSQVRQVFAQLEPAERTDAQRIFDRLIAIMSGTR